MREPDFIIIGAQKCGTTSLFHNLAAHPEVGMHTYCYPGSANETHYFTQLHKKHDLRWYMAGFPKDAKLVGEKCPDYCMRADALRRIVDAFPNVKLIFLVRDPVRRFQSQRNMRRRQPRFAGVDLSLDAILADDTKRRDYLDRGKYIDQIRQIPERALPNLLVRAVDPEYAAVKRHADKATRVPGIHGLSTSADGADGSYIDVCRFLGIEPVPLRQGPNAHHLAPNARQPFPDDERARVAEYYAEANRALYDFLGRDLGWTMP